VDPACPSCGSEVERDFDYCPNCSQTLRTPPREGALSRHSTKRPSTIVLIGMWIIFGPVVVVIYELFRALPEGGPEVRAQIVVAAFYVAILFVVTRNYIVYRRALRRQDAQELVN
jgi:uncharacterized membrane protein